MKKSRGQTLVDFVVLALLAVGIIIFGIYKFGDGIANFFARNDVENKFNNARIVRVENPNDIISDVKVKIGTNTIVPPVEKILTKKIEKGEYIQTSGSAGRVALMAEIMTEYVEQLDDLTNGHGDPSTFMDKLNTYKGELVSYGSGYDSTDPLNNKISSLKFSTGATTSNTVSEIQTAFNSYISTVTNPTQKTIIQTFTNDLLNFNNSVDYFIDPYLYVQYLGEEKTGDPEQDKLLLEAIETEIGSGTLSNDEKQQLAGLIKVNYSGGYSKASPSAHNGRQMCDTFGGTLDPATKVCTIN